ncbi:kelch-like protein 20 [Anneissia japonica]|uniref:kelch-like protein 20 n=1 Tax=Anneissia japonica TaxID=1529436 RepID=UPI0014258FE7|nr:kelch-like protein 20 [Anneissia japonica]
MKYCGKFTLKMMMDFDETQPCLADYVIHRAQEHHGSRLLAQMYQLRYINKLCDIQLNVEGAKILAHKLVLAAFSPYFFAMFTGDMKEAHQSVVRMNDIDAAALELLIKYAYTGILKIHVNSVQSLLNLSSLLQVDDVQAACSDFLKRNLHPNNCLGIRNLADAHTCVDLVEASERFAEKHFEKVAKGDEFLQLPENQLIDLLTSENLHVSSEEEVYKAIMKWVYADKQKRMHSLPKLLKEVRFTFLSAEFLVDTLEMEELIRYDWKCRDILDEAKNYHMFPDRRKHHRLACIKPRTSTIGCIYSVGGMDSSGHSLSSVECYNLRSQRVSIEASMNTPRSGVAITNIDHKIMAIGGYDGGRYLSSVEWFDTVQRRWCPMVPMHQVRRYHSVCTLDRQVYVVGGYNGRSVLDTVECYDPRTNRWRRLASMGHRRRHLGLVSSDNSLCAIGGSDGSAYLDVVEIYEPRIDRWTAACSLQSRRGGVAAAVLGGKIYALGGYDGQANLGTVERYHPDEDRWAYIAPMTQCRSGHGVISTGGSLYVVGGHDGTQYLSTAEKFESTIGEWDNIGSIGTPRAVAGVTITNNLQFT